ncbi:hypothetical protein B0H13DRAFT_2013636 [Mycena leptocephala]|nr:hypothetical protein B0H13DRAFT_2014503 [Mycena leptocephala]KAJ7909852.1 hypothetical protein B0H13DRAFT_2013636 [Mycena leptocephala]
MQLLAAITASLLLVSSATAQSIGLFTEKDFDGEALFPAVDPGACNPVNEPFISHLLSAVADPGFICKMFTDTSCSHCAACVDADGFRNMASVPAVRSFLCEAADQFGCSNANSCQFH